MFLRFGSVSETAGEGKHSQLRKAVSPPLHPFPQAPLEIVRFGHVTLLTGRWILRLFKTPGCADLIGITPFNKKTYPSHHSNTLSNTKIFIDQTYSSHTSNCGRSTHQNVRTGHHASAYTSPAETPAGEVTVLRAATEEG